MSWRVSFLLILLSLPLFAQNEINEVVEVSLVDLYLTATDSKGHFITDLKPEDLQVFENGAPQQIERFTVFAGERGEVPLLLAIVIDNSGSMDETIGDVRRLDLSRDAALSLIGQLGQLDQVMLARFSDVPLITQLTQEKQEAQKILTGLRIVWAPTALFDSVASVLRDLKQNFGRKILFLCSDGQDNVSQTKFNDVIDQAVDIPDLTVVVLGVGATNSVLGGGLKKAEVPDIPYLRSKEYLQKLADLTAGFAYFPEDQKDVAKVLDVLGGYIRSQYHLAYRSTNSSSDKSYRTIEIKTKRRGLTLHYRKGYKLG